MRDSAKKDFLSPSSVRVPLSYAKSLLPSLVIGYLIPTLVLYLPFPDNDLRITQLCTGYWQMTPLYVNILLFILPNTIYKNKSATTEKSKSMSATSLSGREEFALLRTLYAAIFLVTALAHLITLYLTVFSTNPSTSFQHAILRVPHISNNMSMSAALHYIFQVDFLIISVASVAGAFLALCDLRRNSSEGVGLWKAVFGIGFGIVVVGPGAVVAGVWWVREGLLGRKGKV
jgi:hypothetical protein